MNITTQTSHWKIHQLGNLAQTYEQLNHALEFYIYKNENERVALENQKHQLETAKKYLLQQPDGFPLPRPPPLVNIQKLFPCLYRIAKSRPAGFGNPRRAKKGSYF